MKITRIEIGENYNLKHVDISFSKSGNALVVGPNGWGKTNILRSVTTTIENAIEQKVFNPDEREPAMKSFVKVSFALNKDELWTIMKWRLIFVTERMLKLCDILARTDFSQHQKDIPEVKQFWEDVFPELLAILAKSYQSLDAFMDSEADVVVSQTGNTSTINFMKIKLPDNKDEEFNIIADFLKRKFGTEILDKRGIDGIRYEVEEENDLFENKRRAAKQLAEDDFVQSNEEMSPEESNEARPEDDDTEDDSSSNDNYEEAIINNVASMLDHTLFLKGFDKSDSGIYLAGLSLRYEWLWDWIEFRSVSNVKFKTRAGTHVANATSCEPNSDNLQRKRNFPKESDMNSVCGQITVDVILKELQKLEHLKAGQTLGSVIIKFLEGIRSVCVLSQTRGSAYEERGVLFWSMDNAKQQIVNSYLSGKDSIRNKMLQKVREAILVIANVELDVVKQDNPPSNELHVVFRNSVGSDWRKLDEASGGERELILVLTAVHLSGADSVFLDEPGHSLHPPKQAQLRRWLESKKDDNQALFLITHATDMVSSHWLDGLYHMYSDDGRYSAASLNAFVPHTAQPPGKKLKYSDKSNMIELDPKWGDFLMGVEMRRLFFSSGTVFVEGDSDKRVIEALRLVELDRLSRKMKNPDDVSYNDRLRAYWDTQMDQWDIICMNGSANWLKAFQAAYNLKVPFVIVLDADVLNKISGSSIAPITYKDWTMSRLRTALDKELDANHPLAKLVENVEKILQNKPEGSLESSVREELKKHDLWVWEQRDLESALFDEEDVRNALFANPLFKEELEQIGMSFQDYTSKSGRTKSWNINQMKAIGERFKASFGEFEDEFEQVTEKIEKDACDDAALEKLEESIMNKAGKVKQDLKNHQKVQSTKNIQKAEQVSVEDGKQDNVDKRAFFFNLKKKLHQGGWKLISSKALQGWLAEALKIKEDHPFHLLWEHIRTRRIRERGNTEVPPHVMKRLLPN